MNELAKLCEKLYKDIWNYPSELLFKIRNFIDKFSERKKKYILCSVTFRETGTVIRKRVQSYTDRKTIDSNVTGCVVIAYWLIKCRDTNWYCDKKMCTVLY